MTKINHLDSFSLHIRLQHGGEYRGPENIQLVNQPVRFQVLAVNHTFRKKIKLLDRECFLNFYLKLRV